MTFPLISKTAFAASESSRLLRGGNGRKRRKHKKCKAPKRGNRLYHVDVSELAQGIQELLRPSVQSLPAQCVDNVVTVNEIDYPLDALEPCPYPLVVGSGNGGRHRERDLGKMNKGNKKPSESSSDMVHPCLRGNVNDAEVTVYFDIVDGFIMEGNVTPFGQDTTFFVATGIIGNEVLYFSSMDLNPDLFEPFPLGTP